MGLFNKGNKPKIYKYVYAGLYELGNKVTIDEPYLPRQFKVDGTGLVIIKPDSIGEIIEKYQLSITDIRGGTFLQGHEAYFKYNVRFNVDGYNIELHHIPEWLIDLV